ncbi:uncharacterized protein LY89DRAFT_688754 [Mollisia scopiformis]|uniref:F-box domain-containing protein n=1 Tax=Mollisia scopiformis TaxID=149040 RepID=A0A194WU90_MOLSC|nr:uncharacterized protein LY89DRAFT_688754 [Mollisia scopiformis]KUJ11526.1 hypothetical protein LY89DRAFT_688754 [Mollisia scopiformis]
MSLDADATKKYLAACFICAGKELAQKSLEKYSTFESPQIQTRTSHLRSTTTSIRKPTNMGCPITQLPSEILNEILDIAVADGSWKHGVYTISSICRAFHEYSQLFRFREISLLRYYGHSLAPACERVKKLYALVHADAALAGHCKRFSFGLPSIRAPSDQYYFNSIPSDYVLGDKLMKLLPNIAKLEIQGGFSHKLTWPFLKQALCSMKYLDSVKFECSEDNDSEPDLFLPEAWDCVQGLLKLERLELRNIRLPKNGSIWKLSENAISTSPIRNILLTDFGETPDPLGRLLNQPKALEHFSLHITIENRDSGVWSLETIRGLLYNRRASLKSITLGALSKRDSFSISSLLCLQDFSQLKSLALSRWDMGADVTPEVACNTLLGPSLESFQWDFTNPERECWGSFGTEQKDWLLRFAKLAIDLKSKLKKIRIVFNPPSDDEEHGRAIWEQMFRFWPWDLMDEVRDAVSPDIEVTYNGHVTEQECEWLIDPYQRELFGINDTSSEDDEEDENEEEDA